MMKIFTGILDGSQVFANGSDPTISLNSLWEWSKVLCTSLAPSMKAADCSPQDAAEKLSAEL